MSNILVTLGVSARDPTRHPDFSFPDGTIAVLAQPDNIYFLVHQGFLARHSRPLALESKNQSEAYTQLLEGRPVLQLEDTANDMHQFLLALYDGISELKYDRNSFNAVATLLRMSTKYQVNQLRRDILRGLRAIWPSDLESWDARESLATGDDETYEPRKFFPHPILVINLARSVQASEILPSAFYDLSRCSPSFTVAGTVSDATTHCLSRDDVIHLLKGREHASRFLSTFIVTQLEGRTPSANCVYQKYPDVSRKRLCQAAFEAITFEILRDANDTVSSRNSDPLFSILNADLIQSKGHFLATGTRSSSSRPCEQCSSEFRDVVDSAREQFWQLIPDWFNVDLASWG